MGINEESCMGKILDKTCTVGKLSIIDSANFTRCDIVCARLPRQIANVSCTYPKSSSGSVLEVQIYRMQLWDMTPFLCRIV